MNVVNMKVFTLLNKASVNKDIRNFAIALHLIKWDEKLKRLSELNNIIPVDVSSIKEYMKKLESFHDKATNNVRRGQGVVAVFGINAYFDKYQLEMIEDNSEEIMHIESMLNLYLGA